MKISMICFSLTGQQTGEKLEEGLRRMGHEVLLAGKSRYLPDSIEESAAVWTEKQFQEADGIIFIGACGIAVRSIAPCVASKKKDPAVLVADECGRFVISLLSGHLGGANELAEKAAGIIGAEPVITTATDLHSRFAVDVFAKKNGCSIFHMRAAKEVSAAILSGEPAGFYSEFPWEGELPAGLVLCGQDGCGLQKTDGGENSDAHRTLRCGVAVTIHRNCRPFDSTVQIVPAAAALGVGCRKGKDGKAIRDAVIRCLDEAGIFQEALLCMASIDLKKEEAGLLELSRDWKLPFLTWGEAELRAVPGEFTPSDFVKNVTGVDNVCERSAVLAADHGKLLKRKTGANGITTALALKDWRIHFE